MKRTPMFLMLLLATALPACAEAEASGPARPKPEKGERKPLAQPSAEAMLEEAGLAARNRIKPAA